MSQFLHLLLIVVAAVTISEGRIQKRVVNGYVAAYGQFPYMVSLRVTATSSHTCGGSLLNPEYVLTAAHCVVVGNTEVPVQPSERFVVTGHVNNAEGGRVTRIAEILNHPEYNVSQAWRNDISILRLATPIPFTATERPIPLASSYVNITECIITGWGGTFFPVSHLPSQLQTQRYTTLTHQNCASVWGSARIHDSSLCAGARRGEGVCGGDSGSPLVCNGEVAGVASWVNPCANGFPDVYARVSYFSAEILAQISNLSPLGKAYMAEALEARQN